MLLGHGGNLKQISQLYGLKEDRIMDFSSNINPLGITPWIKNAVTNNISGINRYPDPESKLARVALSGYLEVDKGNILVANGANEVIHLIPRALDCSSTVIYQPTFSEYALSLKISRIKPYFLVAKENEGFSINIKEIIKYIPKVDLVILCNPNNPTGYLIKKEELSALAKLCSENKTYLLIDEVFMEFVHEQDKVSLLKEATNSKYLLVLRSLTKFFALPGLRIGYLVSNKDLIKKLNLFLPTWSVNILAQEIITPQLFEVNFIKKTKEYIKRERDFLFNRLKVIDALYPYNPTANFIFCKILDKKINTKVLSAYLIKYGILIRDCSNFEGLDNHFFRVAVRKREDNLYLAECLKKFFMV